MRNVISHFQAIDSVSEKIQIKCLHEISNQLLKLHLNLISLLVDINMIQLFKCEAFILKEIQSVKAFCNINFMCLSVKKCIYIFNIDLWQ